ncbi:DUF1854 domain-containing protein [plant metagenome]|uniref:DUF1854 domain-containing protein n=1 Tax=plant metagenome TaxID=1297885 RepID=A0A484RJC6_9ZZZZ
MTVDFTLVRDEAGQLLLTDAGGRAWPGVIPVRAFPIQAPGEAIALLDQDGKELRWLDGLAGVPQDIRALILEELAVREFTPRIERIERVSSYATPSTWDVVTDRGPTKLVLKGEEDIRRLHDGRLQISDSHGMHYLIASVRDLDKTSRRYLDRFL